MRKRVQCYLQVGRRPEFRRFWLGMMISRAGDAFTTVALSWVVLDMAGPFQLGVVLMCFGLPRIMSGPVAGRLLDRSSPRVLLMADNAARGLLIALVLVLLWSHHLAVVDLYGIAAVCALLSAVTEVAEVALVPRLVDDAQLDTANSLLSANWELAYIVGPAVAGLIVATIGAPFALLFDAVSFAVMAVICLGLPSAGPVSRASPARAGRRRNRLSLRSFPAVLVLSFCGFGLLRLAPDLAVAVVLLGLAAFAWGPYYVFERTLVQRLVPDDIRSRLAGTKMMISSLGFPLGSAIGGALVGAIGVPAVVLAIACAYLTLSLLPLLAPGLRGLGPADHLVGSALRADAAGRSERTTGLTPTVPGPSQ